MYEKAVSTYYALSLFVVGTALFTVYPSDIPEVSAWQKGIWNDVGIAWEQTIGDQPWFSEVAMVYEGVAGFYEEATVATLALFEQPETESDINQVIAQVYNTFALAFDSTYKATQEKTADAAIPAMPENFMAQEPVYNIIPYREVVRTIEYGSVAGASFTLDQPVNNNAKPWITLEDNLTGQLYCIAMYNGAVNQYLGPCKYDYH